MAELAPEVAQRYAAMSPHKIALLVVGRRAVNGDEVRPEMVGKARASMIAALPDGAQCGIRLGADAREAYGQARAAAVDGKGKVPESFRAPEALEPITHLLERVVSEGKTSLTMKRKVVRQGRRAKTSRMD